MNEQVKRAGNWYLDFDYFYFNLAKSAFEY